MYEKEDNGEVREEDLAAILEIMLGVKEVDLSGLFLSLDNDDQETMTYGKTQCLSVIKHFSTTVQNDVRPLYIWEHCGDDWQHLSARASLLPPCCHRRIWFPLGFTEEDKHRLPWFSRVLYIHHLPFLETVKAFLYTLCFQAVSPFKHERIQQISHLDIMYNEVYKRMEAVNLLCNRQNNYTDGSKWKNINTVNKNSFNTASHWSIHVCPLYQLKKKKMFVLTVPHQHCRHAYGNKGSAMIAPPYRSGKPVA